MIIAVEQGSAAASNRKGLTVAVSAVVEAGILDLAGGSDTLTVFDGEVIADAYYVFDLLVDKGTDLRPLPFEFRYDSLKRYFSGRHLFGDLGIHLVTATGDKPVLHTLLLSENAEGIVCKRRYAPGCPGSGRDALKWKFKASGTFQVNGVTDGKRSVSLAAASPDGRAAVRVGNVTVPASCTVPPVGSPVEVEYLYAYRGGSLYQPVYKGPRPDKDEADMCESLKFKKRHAGDPEDDAEDEK